MSNFLQRVRSSQTALGRKKKKKNYVTSSVVMETDYVTVDELELELVSSILCICFMEYLVWCRHVLNSCLICMYKPIPVYML